MCEHLARAKAEAADKDIGDWKVITRDDGSKQWAYKGKPIYYFVVDKAAGDGRRVW
jgi:predicted lipoprotein with Yx(FWY)xxD motif